MTEKREGALVPQNEQRAVMPALSTEASEAFGMVFIPQTFNQALEMAEIFAKSGMVPDAYNGKPGAIVAAWSLGGPLGLNPLQCLQSIANIHGMPSVWGDAAKGIIMANPECEDILEGVKGTGDQRVGWCIAKRRGKADVHREFSVQDAIQAGLWGRQSQSGKSMPWTSYPQRMLMLRARSWALRDQFPDVLRGLYIAEEARDIVRIDPDPGPSALSDGTHRFRAGGDPPRQEEPAVDPPAAEEPKAPVEDPVEDPPSKQEPAGQKKWTVQSMKDAIAEASSLAELEGVQDQIKEAASAYSEMTRETIRKTIRAKRTELEAEVPGESGEPFGPFDQLTEQVAAAESRDDLVALEDSPLYLKCTAKEKGQLMAQFEQKWNELPDLAGAPGPPPEDPSPQKRMGF